MGTLSFGEDLNESTRCRDVGFAGSRSVLEKGLEPSTRCRDVGFADSGSRAVCGKDLNHTHCPCGSIAMFFLTEAFEDRMRNCQLPIHNYQSEP